MMWFMMRGMKTGSATTGPTGAGEAAEIARLRAEVDRLKAADRDRHSESAVSARYQGPAS
jgi:hypothetical protein